MRILGISAFHRDAAAALVVDGETVAAIQEDRYTKRLQDESFPIRAIRGCLDQAGLTVRDLDRVVFYEKPLRKFERELASLVSSFPRSAGAFSDGMFLWLGDRLWLKNRILEDLELEDPSKLVFTEHQLAHAASAFYPSPFDEAAVLTVDDAGEWATVSLCRGAGATLESVGELRFPHSLGMLVSAIAQYLGFEPGAQDHLVEALASHGSPTLRGEIEQLIAAGERGSFTIRQDAFRYRYDRVQLFTPKLEELLGPARVSGGTLRYLPGDSRDADVAASLQAVVEERVLALCAELHERVPSPNLCFAGRLAENRALNARILRDSPFERLYVPPAPHDAGAAIGAALYVQHMALGLTERKPIEHAFLGRPVEDRPEDGAVRLATEDEVRGELTRAIAAGERVGWIRGRHEFGAHSHGHRSILADPRGPDARTRLLAAVQQREPWMPCMLAVPWKHAKDWFELPEGALEMLRFGLLAVPATERLRAHAPSFVQPDGTAWPLLVDREFDRPFHALLHAVEKETGAPLLAHGDFALRGSPLARIEADAVAAFLRTDLDRLFVEDRVYEPRTTTGLPPRPAMN